MDDPNSAKPALIELNERLAQAERNRDVSFMRDVLSDKLVFRRANGSIVDKAAYVQGLLDPKNTYDRLETTDVTGQIYEDLAVVSL